MVSSPSSVVLALCILFLVTADGRTIHAHLHNDSVVSSKTSLLDSTSSSTTSSNDVEGLITLIKQFPGLIGVQFPLLTKDPCYPQKLPWIECSNDDIRRVTALYLGLKNLFGPLPDFSSMDALETIDLHKNILSGPIPEFLGTFPELTYLDLANNYFSGSLPDSLANNKKIKLNLAGNPICSSSNACSPPTNTQLPPPTPTAEHQFPPPTPTVQFQFPPPTPMFDFQLPPTTPTVQFQFPPPTPTVQFQFPPPTPTVQFQFPLPPTPRVESQFPSVGGGGDDGFGSFDLLDIRRRKKSKLPTILGITIPPSFLVTVGGAVYAVCRHRKRKAVAAAEITVEIAAAAVG